METRMTGTPPRLTAYLCVERGNFDKPQPFGVGLIVTNGAFENIFRGYGYDDDGARIELDVLSRLLAIYPNELLQSHSKSYRGVIDRIGHWRNRERRIGQKGPMAGHEFLSAVEEAVDVKRLHILSQPVSHTPLYQRAIFTARDALKEIQNIPQSRSYVQVVVESHTMLDFKRVGGGANGLT